MINAFKCGAPPHGGSAPGIDRIVMLLADEPNIREVIVFPMTQKAEDLMMGASAPPRRSSFASCRSAWWTGPRPDRMKSVRLSDYEEGRPFNGDYDEALRLVQKRLGHHRRSPISSASSGR